MENADTTTEGQHESPFFRPYGIKLTQHFADLAQTLREYKEIKQSFLDLAQPPGQFWIKICKVAQEPKALLEHWFSTLYLQVQMNIWYFAK